MTDQDKALYLHISGDSSVIKSERWTDELRNYLHDFQQPMTVIALLAELAQAQEIDETLQKYFDRILQATNELHQVVSQIQRHISDNN